MKKIRLSNGMVALVDDEDYERVSLLRWNAECPRLTYYASTGITKKLKELGYTCKTRMHRLVLNAKPGQQVDHLDGNGLNNQKGNLRFSTATGNARNRRKTASPTSSRYKGVVYDKGARCGKKKWKAGIYYKGIRANLGRYLEEEDAAIAYDVAAQLCHGEHACTNASQGLLSSFTP